MEGVVMVRSHEKGFMVRSHEKGFMVRSHGRGGYGEIS